MSSESLSRDALIEKVAWALADDWNPERDPILTAMFRDYAATAADAALSAVADDLEAEWFRLAWRQTAFADLASEREKKATVQQWIDAAERVRGLLGKDDNQ